MASPRRPLLVLVLALGIVGLAGHGAAVESPTDSAGVATLTTTELVENTTSDVAATPVSTVVDSVTQRELVDTAVNEPTDGSSVSDSVNQTADTSIGALETATADIEAEAASATAIEVAPLAGTDGSQVTATSVTTPTGDPAASKSGRGEAPIATTDGAGGPSGPSGPSRGLGPESPLTGGAVVGGVAALTGITGRTLLAGSGPTATFGVPGRRFRDVAPGLRSGWGDRIRPLLGCFGYQRFDDSDPLEHTGRERLYERIRTEPGIHLMAVSEAADLPLSTARYHLRVLEHEGIIRSVKLYGKRRYYPPDVEGEALLAALADAATGRVLRSLVHAGPASVSRLAERLDRDPSTVSHHLERLAADGLVERERQGQAVVSTAVATVESTVQRLGADDSEDAPSSPAAPSD